VALAAGRVDEAVEHAAAARAAGGGTYLDVVLALVAGGLAEAVRGESEPSTAALDEAITLADGAGDLVMQAVTRLAAAEAGVTLGRPASLMRWLCPRWGGQKRPTISPVGSVTARTGCTRRGPCSRARARGPGASRRRRC